MVSARLILPGAVEATKRARRRGLYLWDYLLGSNTPDKLSKVEKSILI